MFASKLLANIFILVNDLENDLDISAHRTLYLKFMFSSCIFSARFAMLENYWLILFLLHHWVNSNPNTLFPTSFWTSFITEQLFMLEYASLLLPFDRSKTCNREKEVVLHLLINFSLLFVFDSITAAPKKLQRFWRRDLDLSLIKIRFRDTFV